MFNYIAMLLLITSIFYTQKNSLFGEAYNENANSITIYEKTQKLDFSQEYPQLRTMNINGYYEDAEDDLGLGKNVNLKNLFVNAIVWDNYTYSTNQIPVSLSYLPSVEFYFVCNVYDNFSYLPQALPSLKTLTFEIENWGDWGRDLGHLIKNINQLDHLENLEIKARHRNPFYQPFAFTDQEIEIISTMYNLKTLTINLTERWGGHVLPDWQPPLDQNSIQILKNLLPNTKVEVTYSFYCDPY